MNPFRRRLRIETARLTLLTMERARSHWHDWPSWFESVGYKVPARSRVVDFSSYAMLVNAALAGRGVCLMVTDPSRSAVTRKRSTSSSGCENAISESNPAVADA